MSIDEAKIDAEVEYLRHHTPLHEFARDLREAVADNTLTPLAMLLRVGGNDAEVREEIERIFSNYWSRQIRRKMENEARKQREEA